MVQEALAGGATLEDTLAQLVAAQGGPASIMPYDDLYLTGAPRNLAGFLFGMTEGDAIITWDGNDVVRPNGGVDLVSTGGGRNDVIIAGGQVAVGSIDPQYQVFWGLTFNGGTGEDRIETSGSGTNLGGLTGNNNGIVAGSGAITVIGEDSVFTPGQGTDKVNLAGAWGDYDFSTIV